MIIRLTRSTVKNIHISELLCFSSFSYLIFLFSSSFRSFSLSLILSRPLLCLFVLYCFSSCFFGPKLAIFINFSLCNLAQYHTLTIHKNGIYTQLTPCFLCLSLVRLSTCDIRYLLTSFLTIFYCLVSRCHCHTIAKWNFCRSIKNQSNMEKNDMWKINIKNKECGKMCCSLFSSVCLSFHFSHDHDAYCRWHQ